MAEFNRVRPLNVDGVFGPGTQSAAFAVLAAVVVGALYFAREILIPLTLAVLLSFLLAPVVKWIRAFRIPRGFAVAIVMLVTLAVLLALGAVISRQLGALATDLPLYEQNIKEKIAAFRISQPGGGAIERATETLEEIGREIRGVPEQRPSANSPPLISEEAQRREPPPAPAEPRSEPLTPIDLLRTVAQPMLMPLAEAGLVFLLTIFILLQREDLRDRFIRLFGAGDLNRTTQAINDAAVRLSRYFLLQASLNASFGIVIWAGLSLIGVPSPALWGIISALMRFVPYIGSFIAAAFPVLLAAAIEPGWSTALATLLLFAIGEPLMGHIVEPLVYGRHTGLSPMAIVASATFWTWLWGPIGLILATPLTLCLVVVGQHVARLEFLSVLLSDAPALTPAQSFYQRALAGDAAEVAEQAEASLKQMSLIQYYDEVAFPGLRLAIADERTGHLDEAGISEVAEALDDLIETLGAVELGLVTGERQVSGGTSSLPEGHVEKPLGGVLVVPGRGDLDRVAGKMLLQLLCKIGFAAHLESRGGLMTCPGESEQQRARYVVIATVGGLNRAHMRFLVRRVRRVHPGVPVIAAAFAVEEDAEQAGVALSGTGAALSAASVASLVEMLARAAQERPDGLAAEATPAPARARGLTEAPPPAA